MITSSSDNRLKSHSGVEPDASASAWKGNTSTSEGSWKLRNASVHTSMSSSPPEVLLGIVSLA